MMIKQFNKMLIILLCVMHHAYSAEREIVAVTKDAERSNFLINKEGPFIIGNKRFAMEDLINLTPEQQKNFLEAAHPNKYTSCITGTNNQLFCKEFLPCGVHGADVDKLKELPPYIKKGLEVHVTNDDSCVTYKCFILPGSLFSLVLMPVVHGCSAATMGLTCGIVSSWAALFYCMQRAKQRWYSKIYSVEEDRFLEPSSS
jgi:hypothetical protein